MYTGDKLIGFAYLPRTGIVWRLRERLPSVPTADGFRRPGLFGCIEADAEHLPAALCTHCAGQDYCIGGDRVLHRRRRERARHRGEDSITES